VAPGSGTMRARPANDHAIRVAPRVATQLRGLGEHAGLGFVKGEVDDPPLKHAGNRQSGNSTELILLREHITNSRAA